MKNSEVAELGSEVLAIERNPSLLRIFVIDVMQEVRDGFRSALRVEYRGDIPLARGNLDAHGIPGCCVRRLRREEHAGACECEERGCKGREAVHLHKYGWLRSVRENSRYKSFIPATCNR